MAIKLKQKIFVVSLLLLLLLLLWLIYKYKNVSDSFTNNIEYYDWWDEPDHIKRPTNNVKNIFNELCEHIKHETIKIHSVFKSDKTQPIEKNTNKKILLIQYSGESTYQNPDLFDINFIPTSDKKDNIIILPEAYMYLLKNNLDLTKLLNKRIYQKPQTKKFCLFSVSNSSCESRNQMFRELTKYKKVDSCGKYLNNISAPQDISEYLKFITNYKFMICFENVSTSNYFTEKLINAYLGNTIPIYWGCSNISNYINMDAILYLPPNYTEKDVQTLIIQIKYLDNNEDAYIKKYESIFFKDGKIPNEFNLQKIKEKVKNVLAN